ncbi:hypothetical protein PILCRDRAFT_548519 [Piloderma croceum F 1598]|uniref:Uncharacterized protein n=1 Tax=Piloderma croceum (strain F 1598) TaxID=765440 RepID=A0A0C3B116_PILCF|nr:hypothetical protein PILCRDRAFT_548519 [Piloderma croceum F 1598]
MNSPVSSRFKFDTILSSSIPSFCVNLKFKAWFRKMHSSILTCSSSTIDRSWSLDFRSSIQSVSLLNLQMGKFEFSDPQNFVGRDQYVIRVCYATFSCSYRLFVCRSLFSSRPQYPISLDHSNRSFPVQLTAQIFPAHRTYVDHL